ncbi:PREDICTED: uncharacterized protein LOC107356589 isoform X4 [Acropora digitifera]|uniref:uncharacterized protein LOC107356589 isoform X4 n=1 Tax=Acropora digitifera TaxID=70779 RepID=UPI00077A39B0|nr:PREDICTED: uncharacterized protein LOC107356589 isoform X4 [Acropora digitifera]
MKVKMTSLNILNLVLIILTFLTTNPQAKLIHQKKELNVGEEVSKNDATVVQDENQVVRPRRSVVSKTIRDCYKQFVAGKQPPSGFRQDHTNIRYICQQAPDDPVTYYSTMFDLNYGIPVYSAYVVFQEQARQFGNVSRTGREKWRQEPGITKQASDSTYIDEKIYDKGHLLPAMTYSFSEAYMLSTFTYTNAVPQISGFNRGQWARYEKRIRQYATSECSRNGGDLYLITGISEVSLHCDGGGATQEIPLQDLGAGTAPKVSIPRSMWTAGCCIVPSTGAVGSFAVIGNNLKSTKVESLKMTALQDFLLIGVNGFGGTDIKLFPANPKCSDPVKDVNLNKRKAT